MKKSILTVTILLLVIIIIAVAPLLLIKNSEFAGADGEAQAAISEIDPDYIPWAESIIKLPGGETETLLFCVQAGIGAGIFGFGFGYLVARKKYQKGA